MVHRRRHEMELTVNGEHHTPTLVKHPGFIMGMIISIFKTNNSTESENLKITRHIYHFIIYYLHYLLKIFFCRPDSNSN